VYSDRKGRFLFMGNDLQVRRTRGRPVGVVSRYRQNGRYMAGRYRDLYLPIDGIAYEIGWYSRKV
jgi:hypothetical protein